MVLDRQSASWDCCLTDFDATLNKPLLTVIHLTICCKSDFLWHCNFAATLDLGNSDRQKFVSSQSLIKNSFWNIILRYRYAVMTPHALTQITGVLDLQYWCFWLINFWKIYLRKRQKILCVINELLTWFGERVIRQIVYKDKHVTKGQINAMDHCNRKNEKIRKEMTCYIIVIQNSIP